VAFLCTFIGMIAALIIWVGLYYYLLDSGNAMLNGLAPHFEAISFGGISLFVVFSLLLCWLAYRGLHQNEKK